MALGDGKVVPLSDADGEREPHAELLCVCDSVSVADAQREGDGVDDTDLLRDGDTVPLCDLTEDTVRLPEGLEESDALLHTVAHSEGDSVDEPVLH